MKGIQLEKWMRNKNERRHATQISIVTVSVVMVLVVFIMYTIKSVENTVTQSCFDNLTGAADRLRDDIIQSSQEDQVVLSAMANVLANEDNLDDNKATQILNCYDISDSYLSYVEILRPDNTILASDGTVRDVSQTLDFATEARKGKSISNIEISTRDNQCKIIRNIVPVVKNGETIAILYGTISLSNFANRFDVDIYNGDAYMFVEDGDSGDMILDTWHDKLGNISDFRNRKLLPGNSWDQAISDMKQGKSGRLSILSTKIHEVVYLYYAPTGINNWNVMVMTPQKVALSESQTIRDQLYTMALVIGIVMVGYMVYITTNLLRAYQQIKKLGLEDKNTGLMNRNAYDKYMTDHHEYTFLHINCIYIDVNGLHEINNQYGHLAGDNMLRMVAASLMKNFEDSRIYRIGGDEFVIFNQNENIESVREMMNQVNQQVKEHDYSISYGIVTYENEIGLERITKEADKQMLQNKSEYYMNHERRRHDSVDFKSEI